MRYRHVILEGKPATGKTEISNLFKIFFPEQVVILPELTTVLVRENGLNILEHRRELTDLLVEAVPARARQVQQIVEERDVMVFEESHMGVHWAYSKVIEDTYFLEVYEQGLKDHVKVPDIFVRLDMPIAMSVKRQVARATKDVEVSGELVRQMFSWLTQWHEDLGRDNLVVVDTHTAPDQCIRRVLDVLELEYRGL